MEPMLHTATARVYRLPAHSEPLWRYQDLPPALPAAQVEGADSDTDDLLERPSRRMLLRCLLAAPPRSAR